VEPPIEHLDVAGTHLALRRTAGAPPTVVFLPGLRSDMGGTKATWLEAHFRGQRRAFLRFDYRGHGASTGRFEDFCVSDWLADTLAVLDRLVTGPALLAGSSLGGWLMLLAARARPDRVTGLVGIAAAPDFTEELMWAKATPEQRELLERKDALLVPSAYGPPLPITRRLIEDGRKHLLLHGAPIPIHCPVHLLHGQEDPDVPWQTAPRLAALLESDAVTVELVKDGDHRLSRELDLRRIGAAVDRVASLATTGLPG
jgi:pimeloyl-ACP methyl ester carboxylesterase